MCSHVHNSKEISNFFSKYDTFTLNKSKKQHVFIDFPKICHILFIVLDLTLFLYKFFDTFSWPKMSQAEIRNYPEIDVTNTYNFLNVPIIGDLLLYFRDSGILLRRSIRNFITWTRKRQNLIFASELYFTNLFPNLNITRPPISNTFTKSIELHRRCSSNPNKETFLFVLFFIFVRL